MKNIAKSILLFGSIGVGHAQTIVGTATDLPTTSNPIPATYSATCRYDTTESSLYTPPNGLSAGHKTITATGTLGDLFGAEDAEGVEVYRCTWKKDGVPQVVTGGPSNYEFKISKTRTCAVSAFTVSSLTFDSVPGDLVLTNSIYPEVTVGTTVQFNTACSRAKGATLPQATFTLSATSKPAMDANSVNGAALHLKAGSVDIENAGIDVVRIGARAYKLISDQKFQLDAPTPPAPSATGSYFVDTTCSDPENSWMCTGGITVTIDSNSAYKSSGQGIDHWCDATGDYGCKQLALINDFSNCTKISDYIQQDEELLSMLQCSVVGGVYDFTTKTKTCGSSTIDLFADVTTVNYADRCYEKLSGAAYKITMPSCGDGSDTTASGWNTDVTAAVDGYTFIRDSRHFAEDATYDYTVGGVDNSFVLTTPALSITDNLIDTYRKYTVDITGKRDSIAMFQYKCSASGAFVELEPTATSFMCGYPSPSELAGIATGSSLDLQITVQAKWSHATDRCSHTPGSFTTVVTGTTTFTSSVVQTSSTVMDLACATTHGQYKQIYQWTGADTMVVSSASKKCPSTNTDFATAACTTTTVQPNDYIYIHPDDYSCGDKNLQGVGGYILYNKDTAGGVAKRIQVKCPATLCEVKVDGMKLDYSIDFEISDGAPLLKTSLSNSGVIRGGVGGTGYATVTTNNYIGAQSQCKADGTVDAPVAPSAVIPANGDIDFNTTFAGDLQAFIDNLNTYTSISAGSSSATVYVSQQVAVQYVALQPLHQTMNFCQSTKLEVAVSSKAGQLTSSIGVQAYDNFEFQAQFEELMWETCSTGYRVRVDIALTSAQPIASNAFTVKENTPMNFAEQLSASGVVRLTSPCVDVCSSAVQEYIDNEQTITMVIDNPNTNTPGHTNPTPAAEFTVRTHIIGPPIDCEGMRDTENKLSNVVLRHYNKPTGACNTRTAAQALVSPSVVAVDSDTCFEIGSQIVTDTYYLKVTNVQSVFYDADGLLVTSNVPVTEALSPAMDTSHASYAAQPAYATSPHHTMQFTPTTGSQGGTYTLIVDFEQVMSGGTRRLRAEYVLGAGEEQRSSSLVILPAEVQVEEQLESSESSDTDDLDIEVKGSMSTAVIIVITALITAVLLAMLWFCTSCSVCQCHRGKGYMAVQKGEEVAENWKGRFKSNVAF